MKRQGRDERINARSMSSREYILTFLVCFVLSLSLLLIDQKLHAFFSLESRREFLTEMMPLFLFVGGYVLTASMILSLIFIGWRHLFLYRRIKILGDAARSLAAGDYAVRIPPQRKDGKKDEFEVLYEDFNEMAEKLEGKKILREDFLRGVSHEFRTPLSVISNYITILQSDTLPEEKRSEYLERIRLSSVQLSEMVGNVLQISRLENNRLKAVFCRFDLSEQLVMLILSYDQLLSEKSIELETDFEEGMFLYSDEKLLWTVWANLLSNAVKFTPEGGKISLHASVEEDGIKVTVEDNGCGIGQEDLPYIFEKFYQADVSHATRGNGLGLSLVKNILSLLGGRVEVSSKLSEGTTFVVFLPAERKGAPEG